jgi:hypothetical protein
MVALFSTLFPGNRMLAPMVELIRRKFSVIDGSRLDITDEIFPFRLLYELAMESLDKKCLPELPMKTK